MMKPSEHGNGDDSGKVGSRLERLRGRSFAHGVHEWGSHGGAENADAGTGRGAIEIGAELAVFVANDELGPSEERSSHHSPIPASAVLCLTIGFRLHHWAPYCQRSSPPARRRLPRQCRPG
jgi:hypothetical protein